MSYQFEEASRTWEEDGSIDLWPSGSESMAVDLLEHDDEADVRVTDHTLKIDAEREEASEESEASYLRRERRHGSVHRTVRLPAEIDTEGVAARMNNGVVTVTLPKREAEEAKTVAVE